MPSLGDTFSSSSVFLQVFIEQSELQILTAQHGGQKEVLGFA